MSARDWLARGLRVADSVRVEEEETDSVRLPVACPLIVGAPLGLDTAVETEEPVPSADSVICTLDVG